MTYMRDETDLQLDRLSPPTRVWAGKIATNAENFADRVSVTIPGTDGGTMRWEEIRWQPRNNSQLPKRGDVCCIVMDETGEMWIPVWWPVNLQTGGDAEILTGTATPDEDVGRPGDFYIDTNDDIMYGPKEGGTGDVWPVAMRGAAQSQLPQRLEPTAKAISDWNLATESGFYRGGNAANAPTVGVSYNYFMGYVSLYDQPSGHVGQLLIGLFDNVVFFRRQVSGGWQAWMKISPIDDTNLPSRLSGNSNTQLSDLNAATSSGFYSTLGNPANAPASGYFHVLVLTRGDPGWVTQLATSFYGGAVYTRRNEGGTWYAWQKISPIDNTNLPSRLKGETNTVPVTDANTAQEAGWYGANTGAANLPVADTPCHLEVYCWDIAGNVIVQFCHAMNGTRTWKRIKWGGWLAWEQIWPLPATAVPVNDTNLPGRLWSNTFAGASHNDANLSVESGFYNWSPGAANTPNSGMHWIGIVTAGNSAHVRQMAFFLYGTEIWTRIIGGGGWGAWTQIYPPPASSIPVLGDAQLPARIQSTSPQITDWNAVYNAGWYCGNSAANGPPSGITQWYGMMVNWSTAGYGMQTVYALSGNAEIWERNLLAGVWQPWRQVSPPLASSLTINDTNLPQRLLGAHLYTSDLNSHWEAGWYAYQPSTANSPGGNYGFCHVLNLGSGNVLQKAYQYNGNNQWIRRRIDGGGWQAWRKVSEAHIQSGYTGITFDSSFAGTVWFPEAFAGTPHVTFSKLDGYGQESWPLLLRVVNPSYFQVSGINHGEGQYSQIQWIAVYNP